MRKTACGKHIASHNGELPAAHSRKSPDSKRPHHPSTFTDETLQQSVASSRVAEPGRCMRALVSTRAPLRAEVLGVMRVARTGTDIDRRGETRRGRRSLDNYRELVARALLSDRLTLEEFPVLSQLPSVEQWALAHPRELCPRGKALQMFLRQAVTEVVVSVGEADDVATRRLVEYLQLRFQQGMPVRAIAERWGCSAVQVWRSTGRRALDLVTARFLESARPAAQSDSVLKFVGRVS